MKATGEVMAIGVNVEQALMKAVRGAEIGCDTLRMKKLAELSDEELLKLIGRCTDERMMRIIDGAAQISFSSADLVLMQLAFCSDDGDGLGSVGGLVDGLGLLQPTVSMAVSSLKRAGYIERGDTPGQAALSIAITESGRARAEKLVAQVAEFRPARARARKSSVL